MKFKPKEKKEEVELLVRDEAVRKDAPTRAWDRGKKGIFPVALSQYKFFNFVLLVNLQLLRLMIWIKNISGNDGMREKKSLHLHLSTMTINLSQLNLKKSWKKKKFMEISLLQSVPIYITFALRWSSGRANPVVLILGAIWVLLVVPQILSDRVRMRPVAHLSNHCLPK
jgi:hypothetical protein